MDIFSLRSSLTVLAQLLPDPNIEGILADCHFIDLTVSETDIKVELPGFE